jgi:hypothetical protein
LKVSVGKRVGELLLYGVFIFADAETLWPISHLGALLLFLVGTLGLLLYDGEFSEKQIAAIMALCVAGSIVIYWRYPIDTVQNFPMSPPSIVTVPIPTSPISPGVPRTFEGTPGIPFEDTEVRGVLRPANEPTPPNGCDGRQISADSLKILIGDNAVAHEGMGSFTAVGIRDCDALSMERRPDGIFVNASLYDRENGAVVTIRDNKITALNGANYSARQSRDESRLTIRNAQGAELFYVRFLNPTTIQFRGFLGCSGNAVVWVRENQPVPGFFMTNSCMANSEVGIHIGNP